MNTRVGVASATTVLVWLVLTACGSDGSGEGDAAGEQDDQLTAQEAELAFAECMRDEGVDMPDPSDDGAMQLDSGDMSQEEFDAAFEQCRDKVPFPGDDLSDEEWFQIDLRHAECMREEGVENYPDPVPGEDNRDAVPLPDDDAGQEEFFAMEQTCWEQATEGVEGLDPETDAA